MQERKTTANTRHTESLTLFYLADEASHTHTHPKTQMKRNKKEKDFPAFRELPRVLAARVPSAHTDPQPKASTPTRRRTNRAPTRRRTNQFLLPGCLSPRTRTRTGPSSRRYMAFLTRPPPRTRTRLLACPHVVERGSSPGGAAIEVRVCEKRGRNRRVERNAKGAGWSLCPG